MTSDLARGSLAVAIANNDPIVRKEARSLVCYGERSGSKKKGQKLANISKSEKTTTPTKECIHVIPAIGSNVKVTRTV